MPANPTREPQIYTADDVPLTEIAEDAQKIVDYFNNEATMPFMDIFVEEMDQQTFIQEINEAKPDRFEKLSEGEFPGFQNDTALPDYNELTIRAEEYGKALGMTQKFIENAQSDRVRAKVEEVIEGASETQMEDTFNVIMDGVYDGSGGLWFEVPDNGRYTFDDTHSHVVPDTTTLFNDISGVPDDGSGSYNAQKHIEAAAEHLRHHGWTSGEKVALLSKDWKFKLKDELTHGADFHIPMASGLRGQDIRDVAPQIAGCRIMQTPYLKGDEFYVYDTGIKPVKLYNERELQMTQPGGGPVVEPGDIINSTATMSYGVAMTNPLGAVEFGGIDVDYASVTQRYS